MAEAIGAASGVLALTILAFETSKAVYDTVCSFKSQRRTIQDIQTDLASLVAVLDLIRQQAQGSKDDSRFEPLREPVKCCTATCQEMQEMLNECSKHTKDSRDSFRDWLNMQYREKSFGDFKQRLASYKSTLSITFATINIQDHATTQDSLNELKRSIEGVKEDLEDQLDRVAQAISGAGASLRDLLQADQAQLQTCLDSLVHAQRVADTTQPQIVIERNRGGEESRTLFGTDTSRPGFNLTVSDNEAQRGAVMAAGVHSPETLQALLKGSRAADLVLVLQAMQTQPIGTHMDMLQHLLNEQPTGRPPGAINRPSTINASPRLRISEQEDTPTDVETLPSRAVHTEDGRYDKAL